MSLPIEDYALIGNLHTSALVGKNGSIDWLCLPRFDSGACFASLLGNDTHGYWKIAPASSYSVTRCYRTDSLVLETTFKTDSGTFTVVDCMVHDADSADLIRLVRGDEGQSLAAMDLSIRFDYGAVVPWIQYARRELTAIAGPDMLHLYGDVAFRGDNTKTRSEFMISQGQTLAFVLNWHPSYSQRPKVIDDPRKVVEATTKWWQAWISRSQCGGTWKKEVDRSLITLKALTYAPTGGIVAAPTTSLPEKINGIRNWDYRFCWLRDATFTLYALMTAGYTEEAVAWRDWLLRAVAGKPDDIQIMYSILGERRLTELTLDWLPGYENSAPVRIGNAASKQLQLDIVGEIMDSFHLSRRAKLPEGQVAWGLQRSLIDYIESAWDKPDQGIWEVRGPVQHFTHSKVMAWVAIDRAIKAITRFGMAGPLEQWKALAYKIKEEIFTKGFSSKLNSFVQSFESEHLDASLLLMPLVGFIEPHDPRMKGTVAAIERRLMHHGFVMRYSTTKTLDGLPEGEGAFIACTFWLVDNYVLVGRHDDALALYNRLLSIRNDVGLLAEEYDPTSKRMLGNFPQAFSHISLINTARNLSLAGGPAQHRKTA